jgi:hypothetical protein
MSAIAKFTLVNVFIELTLDASKKVLGDGRSIWSICSGLKLLDGTATTIY